MIKPEGGKWVLYSADGSKKLGEFDTEEEAKKREKQIQAFKHMEGESIKDTEFWTAVIAPRAIEGATAPAFEGREWDITIIGPKGAEDILTIKGREYLASKNGRLYDIGALADSVQEWDGTKVYDNHLTDAEFEERGGMRSVAREWIGTIVKPTWNAAKRELQGTLKIVEESIAKKLKNAWDQGVLKTIGLSIDTLTLQRHAAEVGGKSMPIVEGFKKILSVDLVAEPAAGGGFNRLIAAQTLQEAREMDPQEIQALVNQAVADALAAAKAKEAEDEEARKKAEVAEKVVQALPVLTGAPAETPGEIGVAPIRPGTIDSTMEAVRKLECAIALRDALDEAKLDAPHRKMVEAQFRGSVFEQVALDAAVKLAREAMVTIDPTGQVRGTGTAPVIPVGMNETDKMSAEFLRLVWRNGAQQIGERQEPFVKERLTESYTAWIKAGYPSLGYRRMSEWVYDLLGGDPFTDNEAFKRATEATTTASMTSIIKNALNVMLACDYAKRHRWWDPIVTTEEVDTIDQATLVRVYGMSTLSVVDEGQAYTELSWADEEETAAFVKKGNFAGVTLEALLSDKLQVVRSIPTRLATSWFNTLSALVSSVFTCNTATGPVLGTSGALFNATATTSTGGHANLLTAALSLTAYSAARLAMSKQTDQISGVGQKLLIRPKYILVPVDLEATANQIFLTEKLPGSANNDINPYFKEATPIVVPNWTDATDWALVADPNEFPAIYMIFLRGRQVPELFTAGDETSGAMFTNDTLRYKVRQLGYQFSSTYTCAPIADFRPLHKSNV